jgi:hypothetical protein
MMVAVEVAEPGASLHACTVERSCSDKETSGRSLEAQGK